MNAESSTLYPELESVQGYERFIDNYKEALPAEIEAGKNMKLN